MNGRHTTENRPPAARSFPPASDPRPAPTNAPGHPRKGRRTDGVALLLAIVLVLGPRVALAQIVRGQILDSVTGVPVHHASVTLINGYGVELAHTTSDVEGLFLLRATAVGPYQLRVNRGGYRISTFPDFALDTNQVLGFMLFLASEPGADPPPTPMAIVEQCEAAAVGSGNSVLTGLVREEATGRPLDNARVVLSWQGPLARLLRAETVPDFAAVIHTDASGRYVACAAPRETVISVYAESTGMMSDITTVEFVDGDIVTNERWRSREATVWSHDLDVQQSTFHAGSVHGLVSRADTKAPIEGATIDLPALNKQTRTDARGQFAFTNLPAGVLTVSVRSPGFHPRRQRVHLRRGEAVWLNPDAVRLDDAPLTLDPIIVDADAPETRRPLRDFWRRRERGLGKFLTRAEFERLGSPQNPTDLLRRMEGIRVTRNANYGLPLSNVNPRKSGIDDRRLVVSSTRSGSLSVVNAVDECPPLVFLDGQFLGDPWSISIDDVLSLADIEAVEVYNGVANVPIEFHRAGAECGAIAFWTR